MKKKPEYKLLIWQNGEWCAGVSGPDFKRVHAEAMHYAFMYGQDGPTEIRGIPADKIEWLQAHLSGNTIPQKSQIGVDSLSKPLYVPTIE